MTAALRPIKTTDPQTEWTRQRLHGVCDCDRYIVTFADSHGNWAWAPESDTDDLRTGLKSEDEAVEAADDYCYHHPREIDGAIYEEVEPR